MRKKKKKKLLAEKYVRSKATEQQAMMSTQEKRGVRTALCLQLGAGRGRGVCRCSSVGYDGTPKVTLGSLRMSTAETVFQKKTRERTESKRGGVFAGPPVALCLLLNPCYIMDGMGECECCIRQGGLQGRADTEDTPEASPLMPDMLLRLQGFS